MVMVEINNNTIIMELMKSRHGHKLIRAYKTMIQRLTNAVIRQRKHMLDNKTSRKMKAVIEDDLKMVVEMVPTGCHRRNAAEVVIQNLKSYFLSVPAGVSRDFPNKLWDCLLPQTETTKTLLSQSNVIITVSAYAQLSGTFNYNKMLLAPMGCGAQIQEKKKKVDIVLPLRLLRYLSLSLKKYANR